MHMTDTTFFGEGLRSPERPRGTRVSGRTEQSMTLHTGDIPTLTHLPFVGEAPKVQNTSLPDLAQAGAYYGGTYLNEGVNAAQDGLEYFRQHGLFWGGTAIGLWALGKIKRTAGWLKYKVGEFFSPYR